MQIFATPETSYIGTANAGQAVYQVNDLNSTPHELIDQRTIYNNQNEALFGANDDTSSNHFNFMVGANYTAQDAATFNAASDAYNKGAADMITVQFGQMDTSALFSPDPTVVDGAGLLMTNGNNPFGWDPTNDPTDQSIALCIPGATIQDKLGLIQDLIDGNPVDPGIEATYFGGTGTNITGLKRVNTMRAEIGAMTNRLQDAVTNDQTGVTNQQAAESQIRDVDFASETASFTKEQILTQSATAMLAQANSVPQSVLQLLK
jgi:hypothetical protein